MIILSIIVPCTQSLLRFNRATDMAAFIGKHKLHPFEYRRMEAPEEPSPDWQRLYPEMSHD